MATTSVVRDTAPVMTETKRPLWKRLLRAAGGLVAAVLLLVVIAVALLHTGWGKSFVRGRVEAKLDSMVNGQVSVGDVDYTFMFGEIRVHDVTIRDAKGQPAIALGSLVVDLDRGSLLAGAPVLDEVVLAGVDVTIVQTADGRSNLTGLFKKSDRKPLKSIAVKKLAVAGSATITKPDGTVVAVRELDIAASLSARPAAQEIDAVVQKIAAQVAITPPSAPSKQLAVAIDNITLGRRKDAVDVEVGKLVAGALGIEGIAAHVKLADGHLAGAQSITLGKARIDSKQLAALLGKQLLLDDVAIEMSVTGPADKLAIKGSVKTRGAQLALDGTANVANRARPTYQLALVGTELRSVELMPGALPVETELRVDLAGAGATPGDIDAELSLAVGPTKVKGIAIEGLLAKASAHRGAYKLENFDAHGLGFTIAASGEVAADKQVHGKLTVGGSPAEAMRVLGAAGIAIPRKAPLLKRLDLQVTAEGRLDGELAVALAPTTIAIAGGSIGIAGGAKLDNQKLQTATTRIDLKALDLAALARLAGKPPKVNGTLSGSIALAKTATAQSADYGITVALAKPAVTVVTNGHASATAATAHADVIRARDKAVLATLNAQLPLDKKGLVRTAPMHVTVELARRSLGELADLVPEKLRAKLPPAGTVELHADIAGSVEKPKGTIALAVDAKQNVELRAAITPTASGLAVTATGEVSLDDVPGQLATIDATVAMKSLALAKAGTVDATIDIPDRALASLASLKPKLAELGGNLGGRIAVHGSATAPALDAKLRWHDYKTATGAAGETTIALAGTPQQLAATITHNGALTITADVDRSDPARVGVRAKARAAATPLLPLVPAFAAAKLPTKELGSLAWNMDGSFVLASGKIEQLAVEGTLDVTGGAIAIPHSERRLHDIGLHVASDATGLRIQGLELHETDVEVKDRRLAVTGHLAIDKLKPSKLELSLRAKDWLLFGGPTFGQPDAPRGSANFDIAVVADLTQPVIGIDATVRQLSLRAPDRQDRGHQAELASTAGDVIYLDGTNRAGVLPVTPVVVAEPRKVRPMDIRVHIPHPIRLIQAPFDVMARGELAVTVRDTGVQTRGTLTMESGTLFLFGYYHRLTEGSLAFTDEHPHGWLALSFERPLPDVAMRELALASGGAGVKFAGPPTKPKTQLGGSANAALAEVMAMYNTGHALYVTRPGLPASATVQAPRGDQLFVLTFMASNLPHLLFLDRVTAYADPYASRGNYGRITNVEADHYARKERYRVRAVVRPPAPGRSSAELQMDRLLIHSDRAAAGVGVRAGDRGGGGIGAFVEWSSD